MITPIPLKERQPHPAELAPDDAAPWPANKKGWCWAWDARDASGWDIAWPLGRDGDRGHWPDLDPKRATHFLPWDVLPAPMKD